MPFRYRPGFSEGRPCRGCLHAIPGRVWFVVGKGCEAEQESLWFETGITAVVCVAEKVSFDFGVKKCLAYSCVFRLVEGVKVMMHFVVRVNDIFAVGKKERCDQFGKHLGRLVLVKSLGELKWYSGCYYERDRKAGRLTISQQTYSEELGKKYGVEWGNGIPIPTTWRLWDYDVDEPNVLFPFRVSIGALLWIALWTRPDIAKAVRAVARYYSVPKLIHWNAARSILGYAVKTSSFGISFQKGTLTGLV